MPRPVREQKMPEDYYRSLKKRRNFRGMRSANRSCGPLLCAVLSGEAVAGLLSGAGAASPPEALVMKAAASPCGGFVYVADDRVRLVIPPFPVGETVIYAGCETAPLLALIGADWRVGIVLVHLGSYAVGLCRHGEILSSRLGTGLVHGRTRKGGSSSARFQRRRHNQAREFLDRVCLRAREHLFAEGEKPDFLAFGGPRQTVLNLRSAVRPRGYEGRFSPARCPVRCAAPSSKKRCPRWSCACATGGPCGGGAGMSLDGGRILSRSLAGEGLFGSVRSGGARTRRRCLPCLLRGTRQRAVIPVTIN
jgi:hypothetical protein